MQKKSFLFPTIDPRMYISKGTKILYATPASDSNSLNIFSERTVNVWNSLPAGECGF